MPKRKESYKSYLWNPSVEMPTKARYSLWKKVKDELSNPSDLNSSSSATSSLSSATTSSSSISTLSSFVNNEHTTEVNSTDTSMQMLVNEDQINEQNKDEIDELTLIFNLI